MLFADENSNEGIESVLREIQQYVPSYGEGKEKVYGTQGVVGDQLSVERGVNFLLQVSNGLTPEERVEGVHLEIADFHTKMKFLQVNLYIIHELV